MTIRVNVGDRDGGGNDSAGRIRLRGLKSPVSVTKQDAHNAISALIGALATVGHDEIRSPIVVYISDRDCVGFVSPRGIVTSRLECPVAVSQKHAYGTGRAIVLRTLVGYRQIGFAVPVEIANRYRKRVYASGRVG